MRPLIYIKSAKTGGTSIVSAIQRAGIPNRHVKDMDKYRPGEVIWVPSDTVFRAMNQIPELWKGAFVFAVVRNPYTRTQSGYSYHPECRNRDLTELLQLDDPQPSIYEVDWKREIPEHRWGEYSLYNHVLAPQSEFLYRDGDPVFDHVVRFENLSAEIEDLFRGFGYRIRMWHEKQGRKKYTLSDEDKRMIEQRFAADFRNFGYEMES